MEERQHDREREEPEREEPKYRCQTCGAELETLDDFQQHVQEQHETEPTP